MSAPEPEIWDPLVTPRHLTLFDEPEGAPTILARCAPRMWDGFYVPILTPPYLSYFWGLCAGTDPNGTWGDTIPHLAGWRNGNDKDLRLIVPWADSDGENVYESIVQIHPDWTITNNGVMFEVDRLPWRDGDPAARPRMAP